MSDTLASATDNCCVRPFLDTGTLWKLLLRRGEGYGIGVSPAEIHVGSGSQGAQAGRAVWIVSE